MSKCIKHELSLILDNIMKNNKTNGINESQSLTEMKDENYLDEVLDIQFPDGRASSKKTRRSESERIKEKVQNYLDEYIEIKSNEINENDINSETQINKNDIEEVKEEIKEDKFFNTVKKHTDNFKFLAYSCDYYNSQIGKKRLPKFETVDDYYKFYEIQKMLKTKMKGIKTKKANLGELQVINLILVTENNLDETTQKVLKARKTVIEQELNKENRLLMNEER